MGNEDNNTKCRIPSVGEYLHFWDDGKTSPSRHYICKIERIIPIEESKEIYLPYMDEGEFSLYGIWQYEKDNCDWLYAKDTDVIIEASCPKYDENNLYFVRTKEGGFFSMDIQSSWQGGRLDVDGDIYESVITDGYHADKEAYDIETYD